MGLRILHTADWHMDAPFVSFSEAQRSFLRRQQLALPEKIAEICRREQCDLVLLAGDIFDGIPSREAVDRVRNALADCAVPVFVSPGNHDFCGVGCPWLKKGGRTMSPCSGAGWNLSPSPPLTAGSMVPDIRAWTALHCWRAFRQRAAKPGKLPFSTAIR